MPYPVSVEIGGEKILEVDDIQLTTNTGSNEKGFWARRTAAVQITLSRRARNAPMVNFFGLVTGGSAGGKSNGKLKTANGKIVLQDAAERQTFTLMLNNLWVSNWEFNQAGEDADLVERITLQVGKITMDVSGQPQVEFEVPQFHKPT